VRSTKRKGQRWHTPGPSDEDVRRRFDGERAEEPSARAKYAPFEVHKSLNKLRAGLPLDTE
jgi:hypothetical protein